MIPVAKLRDELADLLDLAARWTRPMSEDRRRNIMHERIERVLAELPSDGGGYYSGDEIAQIRAAVSRDASVTRADLSAALSLLDREAEGER